MQQLINLDRTLFERINGQWTHPWLDQVFPVLTDLHQIWWISFLLLPAIVLFWIWRQRARSAVFLLMLISAIALSDMVSYRIIKPSINRSRPEFSGVQVQLRTHSHTGRSFPSNHAANNFAAATILTVAFPTFAPAFFAAALIVAYSRIYVGVHYPLDVIGGASLGIAMAALIYTLFILLSRRVRFLRAALAKEPSS